MGERDIRELESEVRYYARSFPAQFERAQGPWLYDVSGREYIDFFCGAGSLNYGHNDLGMKRALIRYLLSDGIAQGLDMWTVAKERFLRRLHDLVLAPRGLDYRVQFTGPTGTNAVEAALKLARKVTGRTHIVHFRNAFHGMTLGSLSVCDKSGARRAGIPLEHTIEMPFDGDLGAGVDTLDFLSRRLALCDEQLDLPAGVIVECVQAEGGLKVATSEWLQRLRRICDQYGMLLIVDDIQAGIGRSGSFFSFEPAGIEPDVVCLSKSLSGIGLPLAINLLKPEHDIWKPGEHNGTFRGNNLAFVTATRALSYWRGDAFQQEIQRLSRRLDAGLTRIATRYGELGTSLRGRGFMRGIRFTVPGFARRAARAAFVKGLLVETCGPNEEVLKVMPPLTIHPEELALGLALLDESIAIARDLDRREQQCLDAMKKDGSEEQEPTVSAR